MKKKISEIDLKDTTVRGLEKMGFDIKQEFVSETAAWDAMFAFLKPVPGFEFLKKENPRIDTPDANRRRLEIESEFEAKMAARLSSSSPSSNFEGLVERYQKEKGCKRSKAIIEVARLHPEEHSAYLQRVNQ
jgi:hypothetical protein